MTWTHELAQTRWLLSEQSASSIQTPFLLVLILWLGIIFASFGLFAPRNGTVYAVIFLSALSLSTAVFLILELDQPFDGAIRISDAPLRTVQETCPIASIDRSLPAEDAATAGPDCRDPTTSTLRCGSFSSKMTR